MEPQVKQAWIAVRDEEAVMHPGRTSLVALCWRSRFVE
jgi:hypothetical protein